MKRAIGIDVTDHTVRVLREKGFSAIELPRDEARGYRGFFFPFALADGERGEGFEIHVVEDEEAYVKWAGLKHFFPYFREMPAVDASSDHANTAEVLLGAADLSALESSQLQEAMDLRKQFPLQALHLLCGNLQEFVAKAHPLHVYSTRMGETALIHLGPSCFDLLVSQKGSRE